MIIPGTHYTLHWFMQCKISDPAQVPEFKYVPIPTGATTLPFGTAPYVPTVQISQTKTDWIVIDQTPYLSDAKKIIVTLAKCINTHNFTIFDARDLMPSLELTLPLISHEETACELDFLERQRKGLACVSYCNRKRKLEMSDDYYSAKKSRVSNGDSATTTTTRMLLDMLSYGPVTTYHAAQQLQVPEELVEQVVEVLSVVGQVSVLNGTIRSTSQQQEQLFPTLSTQFPDSPQSPHSIEDSYENCDPVPETPPHSMPMWDPVDTELTLSSSRPYATRSSTSRKLKVEPDDSFFFPSANYLPSAQQSSAYAQSREQYDSWGHPSSDALSLLSSISFAASSSKSISSDMGFEATLDLNDSSDFFHFWPEQY
jgi:hypothetical protein